VNFHRSTIIVFITGAREMEEIQTASVVIITSMPAGASQRHKLVSSVTLKVIKWIWQRVTSLEVTPLPKLCKIGPRRRSVSSHLDRKWRRANEVQAHWAQRLKEAKIPTLNVPNKFLLSIQEVAKWGPSFFLRLVRFQAWAEVSVWPSLGGNSSAILATLLMRCCPTTYAYRGLFNLRKLLLQKFILVYANVCA